MCPRPPLQGGKPIATATFPADQEPTRMSHIAIIGNGIAGITAARHIRKLADHRITVISDESDHFFSRTALMYIYMGHMTLEHTKPYEDWFWSKNRIDLMRARVNRIDTSSKNLILDRGDPLSYDKLIIAVGSKSNYFGWPGQDLEGVQGLYSVQDLEKMEQHSRGVQRAVIVGGGLIGIEMAEMLRTRGIAVTFLVMERHYWANVLPREEGLLVGRHIREHHVELKLGTKLKEILPDERGRVRAVVTDQGETIDCRFVGLTAGVSPNIGMVKACEVPTRRGVLVNEYLETEITDVYAAGDCAEIVDSEGKGRVEQLWYTGRMQGEALAHTICDRRTSYDRGIWFNSAKFFDIEYQTYGFVAKRQREGEASLYWEHAGGKMCLRLVYRNDDRCLVGVNSFGIRYRHRVFERWLGENRTLGHVVSHLREANFDPEFFRRFETDVVALYNRDHAAGNPLQPASCKRLFGPR